MTTYVFKDKITEEIIERVMKMSEHTQFMLDNPHLESHINYTPTLCDPTRISATRKYDTGFSEVLSKIHEKTPGSILNKTSSQL